MSTRLVRLVLLPLLFIGLAGCCRARPMDVMEPAGDAGNVPPVVVMAQVKDGNGEYLSEKRGDRSYNIYQALPEGDPRVAGVRRMLDAHPALVRELKLLEAVKRHWKGLPMPNGADAAAWKKALADPFYFSIDGSLEERGWIGFVLRDGEATEEHLSTSFVELNLTLDELSEGWAATGLAHEMGHAVFYVALAQWVVPAWDHLSEIARAPAAFHDVQRATQPLMAMNEGVAEHLDTMVELSCAVGEDERGRLAADRSLRTARGYVSPRPRRTEMILWNRAIFEPMLLPEGTTEHAGPDEAYRTYMNAQPVDNHRLRSCGEMLSTEGVVAALLTRLILDPKLQKAAVSADLLSEFAPPAADGSPEAWLADLGPEGRVYLRLFRAMAATPAPAALPELGDLGFREIAQAWMREFPADAPHVGRVIVQSTLAATASATLADQLRTLLATPAIVPPVDPKKEEVKASGAALETLSVSAMDGQKLFAACGPPLWISVPERKICGDFSDECIPFEMDLNAAGFMEIMMYPGMDATRAREILTRRDRRGFFENKEEFLEMAGKATER